MQVLEARFLDDDWFPFTDKASDSPAIKEKASDDPPTMEDEASDSPPPPRKVCRRQKKGKENTPQASNDPPTNEDKASDNPPKKVCRREKGKKNSPKGSSKWCLNSALVLVLC
ncbi:MAG: hypothetical protein MJE68_02540 [Proteobacteria bacterium]|nr:hypothetical protein [Pseudomonadota bacterium]